MLTKEKILKSERRKHFWGDTGIAGILCTILTWILIHKEAERSLKEKEPSYT